MQSLKVTENDFAKVWLEDGILFCFYKDVEVLDLKAAKTIVEERKKISGGKSYPCLVDFSKVKNFTREARSYFAEEESAKEIERAAFIVPGIVQKLIANFFLLINAPNVQTRLFKTFEEAYNWLVSESSKH